MATTTETIVSARPGAETSERRRYFPELDGVRAIAIFMVMLFHMGQMGVAVPLLGNFGQTGVDLFFVLSGFLITGILLKSPQGDWHEVRTFYVRRILRIFPLYYLYLLALLALGVHISASFWLYTENLYEAASVPVVGPPHFWSLAVEEQFYLVWPFIVLFLPRRHLLSALWLIVAVAFGCRFFLLHWDFSPFSFTLSRVDALAGGALIAVFMRSGRLQRSRRTLLTMCLLAVLLLLAEAAAASRMPGVTWVQTTKFSALAAFYSSALGLLLTTSANWLTRLLGSSPMRFVGRISYGLYVFHLGVFTYLIPRLSNIPALPRALIVLAVTFICALASWYLMERYFIGLKDKLAPERSRFPASAPQMTEL